MFIPWCEPFALDGLATIVSILISCDAQWSYKGCWPVPRPGSCSQETWPVTGPDTGYS